MARFLWRVIVGLGLALFAGWAAASCTQGYCTDYASAMSACAAAGNSAVNYQINNHPGTSPSYICEAISNTQIQEHFTNWNGTYDVNAGNWTFQGGVPPPQTDEQKCQAMPSYPASFGSNISVCRAGCTFAPGSSAETWTVRGIDGQARTGGAGTYAPTGGVCNGGPSQTQPPPVVDPPRRLCGGGSCYDSAAKQYCAVAADGSQVCVPAPAPQAPGGCISGGDTTLCAGSPPPMPPADKVPDPASQIAASDKYAKTGGDGPQSTTVNNYNNTGTNPQSGAQPTDNKPSQPAPASSAPSGPKDDGTRGSGGGDCNSPPIVEGSAALGMVVTQQWLARCKGDGVASNDGDTTVPGLDGIGTAPGDGFMKTETLLDKLDQGGLGGAPQCPSLPRIDIPMFGVEWDGHSDDLCNILGVAGKVILLLAAFISLRILASK